VAVVRQGRGLAYGEAGQEAAADYLTSLTYSSGLVGGISQGTGNTPIQNGLGGWCRAVSCGGDERSSRSARRSSRPAWTWASSRTGRTRASLVQQEVVRHHPVAAAQSFHWFFQAGAKRRSMRNRGWEASLNVRPVQDSGLWMEVGLQWARNRNVVLSLGGQQFISVGTSINRWRCRSAGRRLPRDRIPAVRHLQ